MTPAENVDRTAQLGCLKVERGALTRRVSPPRGVKSLSVSEFNRAVNVQLSSWFRRVGEFAAEDQLYCPGA